MNDELADVQRHFSEGRVDEAIASVARLPEFHIGPNVQARDRVQLKSVENFPQWARQNAALVTTLQAPRRPASTSVVYYTTRDGVTEHLLDFRDQDPEVFVIEDAIVPAGMGMISVPGDKVLIAGPTWGKVEPPGERPKRVYGNIATRSDSDEFLCRAYPLRTVTPEAVYLSPKSKHFGMNVVRLAHLALVREAIGRRTVPLLSPKHAPFGQLETDILSKLWFNESDILELANKPVNKVERLWTSYSPITLFPKEIISSSVTMKVFRRAIGVVDPPAPPPGGRERIYISRRDTTRRNIENEAELAGILQEHGFKTMEFTELGLGERIQVLQNAEIIFGSLGANLFNMIFAPAGCWVVELVPDFYPDPAVRDCIAHEAESMGHHYLRISCDVRRTSESYTAWNIVVRGEEVRTALNFLNERLQS